MIVSILVFDPLQSEETVVNVKSIDSCKVKVDYSLEFFLVVAILDVLDYVFVIGVSILWFQLGQIDSRERNVILEPDAAVHGVDGVRPTS